MLAVGMTRDLLDGCVTSLSLGAPAALCYPPLGFLPFPLLSRSPAGTPSTVGQIARITQSHPAIGSFKAQSRE